MTVCPLASGRASDRGFYAFPRFVTHVDDTFLRQLTQVYRERIPAGAAVLDLCSSWISHLPEEVEYSQVIGHGLNAEELRRNRRLARQPPAARCNAAAALACTPATCTA